MTACACGGPLTVWLDWPQVPIANANRWPGQPPAPRHDLTLGRCHVCGTTALMTPCPPRMIFPSSGYPYRSGVAAPFLVHAAELAARVHAAAPEGPVLDVGGNDGSLRDRFRAYGRDARVVDPCVPDADVLGFFPDATRAFGDGTMAAITALNVFAHIPDPLAFATEVRRLLAPDGVFVIEVLWIGDVLRQGALDTLYHEHWWHWSLAGLTAVLARAGLTVTAAEHLPVQGGSVRVWATPGRGSARIEWDEAPLLTAHPYRVAHATWDVRIDTLRDRVTHGRWAGYAATAKATLLAHAAELGPKTLAYVVDDAPTKQGRLTPYDVPIVDTSAFRTDPVDGVLLFAPSYADTLRANLAALGFDGQVVVA